ncbi:putative W2 domain, MIF4G-like domain superfamily protein [Plasmopara halstedii]
MSHPILILFLSSCIACSTVQLRSITTETIAIFVHPVYKITCPINKIFQDFISQFGNLFGITVWRFQHVGTSKTELRYSVDVPRQNERIMVRGKKIGLGEFLGDQAAAYIPEAALPSGPRARADDDDGNYRGGGRGGDRFSGDRFADREPSRSEQSDQWRGDRGSRGSGFGGDRGGDRFGRGEDGGSWRGGGDRFGGPSRYERPSRDEFQTEERPAHMRLNLARRGESSSASGEVRSSSSEKWSGAFGGGSGRFGGRGGDRFGDRGNDRYGDRANDRFGDRFGDRGGDRFGDRGSDRFGDRGSDRFGDRGSDRFGREDRPAIGRFSRSGEEEVSSAISNIRVSSRQEQEGGDLEIQDKKARAKQKREERKKKAEEERIAAEEAKRVAAEKKKETEEASAKKAKADRETMNLVLASGKKGEELAQNAKEIFKSKGRPSGAVLFETVTAAAEDVAKSSANWIAMPAFGELLKLVMVDSDKKDQMGALYALQVFLNKYDFPKGLLEKCFMALYSLDIIDEAGFFEYKYDVDGDVPGRMKAIIQTSTWLTWLETPEEESDDEDKE